MNFKSFAFAAAALVLTGVSASAATYTTVGGGATNSCSLENLTVSVACNGDFSVANTGGNPAGSDLDNLFFVDGNPITGWAEIDKINTSEGGGIFEGSYFAINSDGNTSGKWYLINDFSFDPTMFYSFTLKGSTDQVAYLLDITVAEGFWTNADIFTNKEVNNAGLSNMRLFKAPGNDTPPPPAVPLPAAGWLLLGGLGGLAAIRRRKS